MGEQLSPEQYYTAEGFEADDIGYSEKEVLAAFERAAADLIHNADEDTSLEWHEKKNRGELPSYQETLHEINVNEDARMRQIMAAERFKLLSEENKAYMAAVQDLHASLRHRLSTFGAGEEITAASQKLVETWREMGTAYDEYCKGLYDNEQLMAKLRAGHEVLHELDQRWQ